MPNKNKISIYLIKKGYVNNRNIIEPNYTSEVIDDVGIVYLGASHSKKPQWVSSFFIDKINSRNLFVSNAKAVLLTRVNTAQDGERIFAIVMGYGKSMLKDNIVEERFGLKVVLNTIKPDSLRRINKKDIGGNQKLTYEQLPKKADIAEFGIDINRDLVSYITGISDDKDYSEGVIAGGDILSLSAEVDITNIKNFLKKTFTKYYMTTYKKNFVWIDHIQDVKDSNLTNALNNEVIKAVNSGSNNIGMAVPEIVEWSEIKGFKYLRKLILDDIYIDKVKKSLLKPLTDMKQLRKKKIIAISSSDDSNIHCWTAAKCLYGEITYQKEVYILSNGKWYHVNRNFVKQINQNYKDTHISTIVFDDYTNIHQNENSYSKSFVNNHNKNYLLMDSKNIQYGGGQSKIELCDILSIENELIHIKPYISSATLSHLFNQAMVSAELLLSDIDFLKVANEKIKEQPKGKHFLIKNKNDIKIVIAIISKSNNELPDIPFFSKVSLKNLKSRLRAFNLPLSIKTIHNKKKN